MNKKDFLNKLEDNLIVLEANERKDIINDYREMIDDKIKDGCKEEDAVKSFGNIDELTNEILKSYKINTEYNNKKSDVKRIIKDSESWIKDVSKKLANSTIEFFKGIRSNGDLTIELLFEILIKIIILVIVCAIMKIPFILIRQLGITIFRAFDPFAGLFIIIWQVLIALAYFVACILMFFIFFKGYFRENDESIEKSAKLEKKNEVVKEKMTKENTTKKKDNRIINILKHLINCLVIIFILIPIIFVCIGLVIGILGSLFFLIQGVNVLGLFICLVGMLLLTIEIYRVISGIISKKHKANMILIIISCALIGIGGIMFINNVLSFNYYDKISPNLKDFKVEQQEIEIQGLTNIKAQKVIVDDTMADNKIKLNIKYNDDYYDVSSKYDKERSRIFINIIPKESDYNNFKKSYKIFIEDLKNNSIYNYSYIDDYDITVYANSNTINLINLSKKAYE